MMQAIGRLETQFSQFQVEQRQFFEEHRQFNLDHRLAMYPIYDHFARQGHINPAGPHPSWYQWPQGAFGTAGAAELVVQEAAMMVMMMMM